MHTCSGHAAWDPHSVCPYSRVTPTVKRGEVGVARPLGRKEHWARTTCSAEGQQVRAFEPALNAFMYMWREETGTGFAMSWESDLPRPESGDSLPAPASARRRYRPRSAIFFCFNRQNRECGVNLRT